MATTNKRKSVKQGKTNKGASRNRPVSKHQKTEKGFPFLALFVALLLLGFIVYFIYSGEPAPAVAVKKEQQRNEEVLPEKPQSQWEYEGLLKDKEVFVDIPEEKKAGTPYQMQCGSFRKQTDAESLKAQIAFQGLSSQVKKTGNWFRVILGPYDRKRVAEKERHKLQRARINGCQIWLWR
ncbi:SPOR domain-containing protein [Psychromonas antarctica]|jgi:cell division protein FtsN|uniref:SPOR domain-containing protein n=1 Tax=Psychromonas antarctica TaxID=67573 RepID=UPI001EE81D37|nr:SPOR domain-containing protein [Psychromonas antarctica]MCG6202164.1 SPOR domain-containing protein [Psychromonas antarctica]